MSSFSLEPALLREALATLHDAFCAADQLAGSLDWWDPSSPHALALRFQAAVVKTLSQSVDAQEQSRLRLQLEEWVTGRPPVILPIRGPAAFSGRRDVVESLVANLCPCADNRSSSCVVVLVGLGGVGKTTAAVEFASTHRARTWFTGGILSVDASSPVVLADSVERLVLNHIAVDAAQQLLWQSGFAAAPTPTRRMEYGWTLLRKWLAERAEASRPWLLLVDAADTPSVLTGTVLWRELLSPGGLLTRGGSLLVASRSRDWPVGISAAPLSSVESVSVEIVDINLVTCQEACIMLLRYRHSFTSDAHALSWLCELQEDEATALRHLASESALGGLPLALEQAGTYARQADCTWVEFAKRFDQQRLALFSRPECSFSLVSYDTISEY